MKSILLHVGTDTAFKARLQAALDIARAFDGHITCLQSINFEFAAPGDFYGAVAAEMVPVLREQAQQFLQQTYAEIGVEMTISNLPPAVMWGEYWTQSQFDSVMVGVVFVTSGDPDVTSRFHSGAIPVQGGRGANNNQYVNPEVDALLEEGTRTFDPEARREIYWQVQEKLREDLPLLPIFQYTTVRGHKEGLKGIEPNINTRIDTWHAAAYYWDE